ncbi:MAG: pyruvate, water dikinase regulatory protein [Sedimentibacter sp.]|uniref:pyruvate, water dikinase regulatory protein n=1 Tax=Sedimentibacter sp. TaxID=1960295 RepID=UPI002981073B|nr:pyruvate, water dikinase regulatory protein [Sedimentibacter sp.]MDW5300340.1 pyruvate, water dikinase regulatory protein [Sedimentibacter sp.]
MDKINIYAVSDSIGETAEQVAKAVIRQFDIVDFDIKRVSYINDKEAIDGLIAKASLENSFIVFTLVVEELRDYLTEKAVEHNIGAVDVMTPVLLPLVKQLGLSPKNEPGLLRKLDEKYFKRVEAIEFAVKYDDGKDTRGILLADIVLIGVSRTSKTPLSMYLAHKNIKVANIPLVPEVSPPDELKLISPKKIIGLTLNEENLNKIRRERLKAMGLNDTANYANMERIFSELEYSEKIMKMLKCKVIDTTNKAVEETASIILDYIADNSK